VTTSATVESGATTAYRESTFTVDVAGPTDYREPTPTATGAETPPDSGGATDDTGTTDGPGFGPVEVAGGLAGSVALFRWLSDRAGSDGE